MRTFAGKNTGGKNAIESAQTPAEEEEAMKSEKKKPKARKATHQDFSQGCNEEQVRKILAHYENQSEDDAVAEDEAAYNAERQTVMIVPTECVPAIRDLIAQRQEA